MSFNKAFIEIIDTEKGFVNHPKDKGKATKYGITIGTLSKWRKKQVTVEDVKNLTLSEAKKIYKAWYWDEILGDKIKLYSIAFVLFDQAVNSGVETASKRAQKILGLTQDGKIGPKTLTALNSINEVNFLNSYISEAKNYYHIIANNEGANDPDQAFYKGWINRANKLSDYASENLGAVNTSVAASVVLVVASFLLISLASNKNKLA